MKKSKRSEFEFNVVPIISGWLLVEKTRTDITVRGFFNSESAARARLAQYEVNPLRAPYKQRRLK
jgi:hypothetical protein